MNSGTNKFIIVIGVDIESYTKKSIIHQLASQKNLERWVIDGCQAAQIALDPSEICWVDSGDGGYLLFETAYARAIPFLEDFYRNLTEYNNSSRVEAQQNVRSAVHCSDTIEWEGKLGRKFAGNAINVCARILDGMPRNYSNQVVCSGDFVRKVSATSKLVEPLRLPDHIDKHNKNHEVWNISKHPGFGIKPNEEDLHEDPNEWHLSI